MALHAPKGYPKMLDQPAHQLRDLTLDRPSSLRRRLRTRSRRSSIVWRMVAVSSFVLIASIATYPFLPRTYTASASVMLRPTNQEGATTWDQSVRDALDDNAIQTKIDIFRSEGLQLDVIKAHDLLADPEFNHSLLPSWLRQEAAKSAWLEPWLPEKRSDILQVKSKLVRSLIVKRERKSYLIQVGYESGDPAKAAALTNSLVNGFLADQINRKLKSHEALL